MRQPVQHLELPEQTQQVLEQEGIKDERYHGLDDRVDTSSILTVPNFVSSLRVLLLVPLAIATAKRQEGAVVGILVAIGITDWADGVLARALRQISTVGQVFDPVCDRIAVGGALIAIVIAGFYPTPLAVAVLVREAVISVATILLALGGWPRIKVTLLGKAGTLMLMFSFPLYVVAGSNWDSARVAGLLASVFAYPGVVAYYVALGQYAIKARRLAPLRR